MRELAGHEGDLLGLAFSPDGRWLASGARGESSVVQLWDADGYAPAERLRLGGSEDSPGSLRFSPDSRYLSAGLGRRPMIWDVKSRRLRFDSYAERDRGADSIAFSRDGKVLYGLRVASGPWSEGVAVEVWARPASDLKGGKPAAAEGPGPWPILAEKVPCPFWHDSAIVGEAADGTLLLRFTLGLMGDGPLRKTSKSSFRLSPTTGRVDRLGSKAPALASAAVSPDGRSLVAPASGGRLKCFDLSSDPPGEAWNCTLAGGKAAEVLAHSGCSRYLAAADADGVVRILDAAGGGELFSFDWGQGEGKARAKVRALAFSADGGLLAIGGSRKTIAIVDRAGR